MTVLTVVYIAGFAIVTVLAEVFVRYARYASVLRWLTLSLFAYVGAVFAVGVPWLTVAKNLVFPHVSLAGGYLTVVVAVFGTTISPYLFFWQAAEEVEDEKEDPTAKPLIRAPQQAPVQMARMQIDTLVGMGFSNIIALFIMLTTAATLNAHGVTDIQTSSQAAEALRPIAGRFAFTIFALGIIGTGLLAVPVLAGSAAYAVGEALKWRVGLAQRPGRAPAFYGAIALATSGRRNSQLHPARPHQGLVLERRHQRGRRGSNHGHDHADGFAKEGHGPVRAAALAEGPRLGRDRRYGGRRHRHVRNMGGLSRLPSVTLARALARTPDRFSQKALTALSGFNSADGVFRFRADGTNERGLAVMAIDNSAATVISPARAVLRSGEGRSAIWWIRPDIARSRPSLRGAERRSNPEIVGNAMSP